MTAIMPERTAVDLDALRRDLTAVLVAHGLTGLDSVSLDVHEIIQGDAFAGVTVSAHAYQRPAHLPPASECARPERHPFAELADRLDPKRPALRVVKGGAE
ncbi:hypothetical protein AB0K34_10890 [Actinomadura sp. NPDC049382]|uniref:hypothetical protein n=1 Tax=Actinomadura sp. NPDC049382 TaxID=3158220 RepID=UPI003439EF90